MVLTFFLKADISKDFLSNPHAPRKPVSKNYIKKAAQLANYSDNESQIMCIELDKNNMTIQEEYVSVADLYNLASKHVDQAASVRVNDYSAFKNSLNFQLQAAKAAAIAENGQYDVVNKVIINQNQNLYILILIQLINHIFFIEFSHQGLDNTRDS